MSYTEAEVFAVTAAMDKYRDGNDGEVGAALVVGWVRVCYDVL